MSDHCAEHEARTICMAGLKKDMAAVKWIIAILVTIGIVAVGGNFTMSVKILDKIEYVNADISKVKEDVAYMKGQVKK